MPLPTSSRVLFAGCTGLQKGLILSNLADFLCQANGLTRHPRIVNCVDIEDLITQQNAVSWSAFIRNFNSAYQRRYWESAVDSIARSASTDHLLVSLHLTYCIKGRFVSLLQLGPIERFQPTHIVTLIDDVYEVWCRIAHRDQVEGTDFRLRLYQAIAWRSAETVLGEMLSRFLTERYQVHVPHYVVSVKHSVQTLYRLLYEQLPRFYLALPISNTRKSPEHREEIDRMRRRIHSDLLAFDPLTIDEDVPSLFERARTERSVRYSPFDPELRWPFIPNATLVDGRTDIYPFEIPSEEILEIEPEVGKHIPSRDYTLIDQAECLAAYRPRYAGQWSQGMLSEFNYAANSSLPPKDILIHSPESEPIDHPFLGGIGDRYEDVEEWHEKLRSWGPR